MKARLEVVLTGLGVALLLAQGCKMGDSRPMVPVSPSSQAEVTSAQQPPPPKPPGQGTPPRDIAKFGSPEVRELALQVATARCDRHEQCGNIGSGHQFNNKDACVKDTFENTRNDFRPINCTEGVDRRKVGGCLGAIRSEQCADVLVAYAAAYECDERTLCAQ